MNTKKEKAFAYVVMGIYLLFLCWLVLFKLADSIDKIPFMRGINLSPFHYDQLSNTRFHQMEVLYNIQEGEENEKNIISLITILLAVSLCDCSTRMDGQGLISTEAEETETQVLDEFGENFSNRS